MVQQIKEAFSNQWLPAGVNFIVILSGCVFFYGGLREIQIQIRDIASDRLTATMYIDMQSEISRKNDGFQQLTPREVREIQLRNLPK